ncbi:4-oxalocrotonate tautomerase family protein [Leucobacter albus]|uniref:4-oxalocrotonate tautomerase family protein n=1 Tax=Leucobacter albus TaxID=272210 RepID=A0ABW3TPG3_9MICO
MANIRVEMSPRSQVEREEIIAELTDVMVKHGSPRESTFVILYEVSHDVWAKGGVTYTKRMLAAEQGIPVEELLAAESLTK